MSKTVGYILVAAEIAFAIALTIAGGPAGLGLSLAAVTAINAALTAAIVVNSLLMPKPKVSRNAQEVTLQFGEIARRAAFGKAACAGSLVDVFTYGGNYGTDREVVIIALADHYCEDLEGVFVNDKWVPWVGDGNYPEFDTHHLSMYFRNGSETQALPSVVTSFGGGWTSDDNGAGVCYFVADYLSDSPTAKHPAFPGGRPSFLPVLKGKRCYDPRKDDTVGGSGTHRWDDPSTWEYSENPIICHYNYMRGVFACDRVDQPDMLLVGRGLTATEVPPSAIFAAANLCDEDRGDGNARYRCGGIIGADEKYLDVAEKFAAACGGIIIQPEGSVAIEPAQSKTPSFHITDADLVAGSRVQWNQRILGQADSEWVNTVSPKYVSPDQKWQDHAAPVRPADAALRESYVVADGGSREEDLVLQLVTDERQAGEIGEIHLRLGRLWGRGQVTLPPWFAEVEEGDWGTWQSDLLFGGETITVRVENYGLDEKYHNTLKLREINAAVYDGVVSGTTGGSTSFTETTPPGDTTVPGGSQWTLTAIAIVTGGVSVPALKIAGSASDDTSVAQIQFEYWKADGVINPLTSPDAPAWLSAGLLGPSTTEVDITSIEGGAQYYASVTYIVSGQAGDRRVLGPVTAGSMDVSGQVNPLIDAAVGKLAWKQPVRAKTTAALAANTYANGASGVGATLTATANGALAAQDGVTLAAGERLLVANEATGSRNGIYALTQAGDATHPYILTRTVDADTADELVNAAVKLEEGAAHDQEWQCTTNAPITIGTTALVWEQASGGGASLAIKDEGSTLTSSPVSMNYVGAGVSAADDGSGHVTVTIPGVNLGVGWSVSASWDFTVSGAVAQLDSGDLTGLSEALVIFSGVTLSASDLRLVRVSTDGTTFDATASYLGPDDNGVITATNTGFVAHSTSSAAARTCFVWLTGLNLSIAAKTAFTPNRANHAAIYTGSSLAIKKVRAVGASGNMNGGKAWILAR